MIDETSIRIRYQAVRSSLDERGRRLHAAAEAISAGHGGVAAAARATKVARSTIGRGIKDLREPASLIGKVRRKGAGRLALTVKDPTLLGDLTQLLEPATMGDPMRPLRWVSKSHEKLATALCGMGHQVSASTVPKLLQQLEYRRHVNRKTKDGSKHPDRDAQFEHINACAEEFQAAGEPVISVDTKKKELIGEFKNPGSDYGPKGQPIEVDAHDFENKNLGKVVPYGIYDTGANSGYVSLGIDHDTAEFAVNATRLWLERMGRERYPDARKVMVTADCGGSNGPRLRLWKVELQRLADETGLTFQICLYPPGTSKWNKVGVSRTHPRRTGVWSYTRDGGRPPETGSQVQVSNHCKLLSSKAMVVSVAAKGGTKSRQVWSGEASESKPSMTCRNSKGDVKTGGAIFSRDQRGGGPEVCPSGIRHVGGAKPDQALVWNVRTCRPDAKGETQVAKTTRARVPKRGTGAERSVVGTKVL